MFKLKSDFKPTGDQPEAIKKLVGGVKSNLKNQVLLGVTGSGKTFTMANVIDKLQMPALIISHNKTLAGQLYQEMRDFFPENGVSYFVSYYDYYQPEAYIPHTDTFIDKEAQINELIDKLRLKTTANILTRKDVIVAASVSCIYNIGSPIEFGRFVLNLFVNQDIDLGSISLELAKLQYDRSEFEFKRGTFRVRGNRIDIYPAYDDVGLRVILKNNKISKIFKFDPLTGKKNSRQIESIVIFPSKHYMTDPKTFEKAESKIRLDLEKEYKRFKKLGKNIEAERLLKRVSYDLEIIKEVGYVNGIENYSRYLDGRKPGDPGFSLLDYFIEAYGNEWLLFIDESHMTVPQLRGMYNGDFSRKKTLIDFGFRLKAAFDNRPLKFDEFYGLASKIIFVSATPADWEIERSEVVEQLVRPTGIIDPKIIIKKAEGEIEDLILEIEKRVGEGEKILVTTLTKKTAEDLADYLKDKKIRCCYLHSDVKTLERSDILDNLRQNKFDVLIGVNLLREGLDLPEVSLVAILDADREGFLRSKTALIQTMGRAARNIKGEVIVYADQITKSIKGAINEINRRRDYQRTYNIKHNIKPKNIYKPFREKIIDHDDEMMFFDKKSFKVNEDVLNRFKVDGLTPYDKKKLVKKLRIEMRKQADEMNFEMAIKIREMIKKLKVEN